VVAAGGGGTISQVATGIGRSACVLGVLPIGTRNHLAHRIGVNRLPAAYAALRDGAPKPIDVISWCTPYENGTCLSVASVQFDDPATRQIDTGYGQVTGIAALVAGMLTTLPVHKPKTIEIWVDHDLLERQVNMCVLAHPKVGDGLMNVCLLCRVNPVKFLQLPRVFMYPAVQRAKHVRISADQAIAFSIDGERIESTDMEFEIQPGALQLLMPKRPGH